MNQESGRVAALDALVGQYRKVVPPSLLLGEILNQLSDIQAGAGVWKHTR